MSLYTVLCLKYMCEYDINDGNYWVLRCYLELYISLAFTGSVGGRGGDFPAKRLHL